MSRILFVDVDGVLNSNRFMRKRLKENKAWVSDVTLGLANCIDPVCLGRLAGLVQRTGAKIVISSSWRIRCDPPLFEQAFARLGFPLKVFGRTPRPEVIPGSVLVVGLTRGAEIDAWLRHEAPRPVESFVILDDQSDMEPHMSRLVKIHDGLEDAHIEQAVILLEEP